MHQQVVLLDAGGRNVGVLSALGHVVLGDVAHQAASGGLVDAGVQVAGVPEELDHALQVARVVDDAREHEVRVPHYMVGRANQRHGNT